jgi:hypothetical protein
MEAFDQAAAEIRSLLEGVARRKGEIHYSELTQKIQTLPLDPNDPMLVRLLDSVSRSTHTGLNVMLSAVVVHKDDHRPGKGFFKLARELGHQVGHDDLAELEFHARELEAVYRAYAL